MDERMPSNEQNPLLKLMDRLREVFGREGFRNKMPGKHADTFSIQVVAPTGQADSLKRLSASLSQEVDLLHDVAVVGKNKLTAELVDPIGNVTKLEVEIVP